MGFRGLAFQAPKHQPFEGNMPTEGVCFDTLQVLKMRGLLGGSWDLVSTVISTLTGVIIHYEHSYLIYNPSY